MMNNMKKNRLYFVALGGADEIGMNMYVYACNGKFIMVDAGYGFLNDNYPGIDLCFADAGFFADYAKDFEGIFITHAHEDHFGAISHVWPLLKCPVYACDFTIGLAKKRLKENHLDDQVNFVSVNNNRVIKTPNFQVEFISMVHSVPETAALFISTSCGTAFHATDWRFDDGKTNILHTDYDRLQQIGKQGVDLLVCDSTNVLLDNKLPSEYEVRQCLINLIPKLENTVVATCFASNITRLESLVLAAQAAGRTPVLMGRSLLQNVKVAKEIGYFKDIPNCHDFREAEDIPSDNALYICTGSQANYRSALTSIVGNQSKLKLFAGDNVIFSSKIIPGNEEKINEMQEKLIAAGVNVITDRDMLVHTSGHCSKEEIRALYDILQPRIVLPVHGDRRFIREHKKFARECGIKEVISVENGDLLCIDNGKAKISGCIPTDILAVDRTEIVSLLNSDVIKRRKQIAYNGSVFISVIFGENWELVALRISSKDILEPEAFGVLRDKIVEEVSAQLPQMVKQLDYKETAILDYIRVQIRRRLEKATQMKPVTFIHFYKLPLEAQLQPDDTDFSQPMVIYPSPEV